MSVNVVTNSHFEKLFLNTNVEVFITYTYVCTCIHMYQWHFVKWQVNHIAINHGLISWYISFYGSLAVFSVSF